LPVKGKQGKNPGNWESAGGQEKAPDRQEKALNSQFFSVHLEWSYFFYI
jgi:hypothetical protein